MQLATYDLNQSFPPGYWISRPSDLRAEELEGFVQVASKYAWPGRSKADPDPKGEAGGEGLCQWHSMDLLRDLWGNGSSGSEESDPCMEEEAESCLRVLILRRGFVAKGKRAVVNLEDAVRLGPREEKSRTPRARMVQGRLYEKRIKRNWIAQTFPKEEVVHEKIQVRVAVVEMERFETLGEEVRVAELTHLFVGTYGSGMWWTIFMAAGSCVMWLVPHINFWYHEGTLMDADLQSQRNAA
eukprot:s912_g30.t1